MPAKEEGIIFRVFRNRGYGFVRDKEGLSRFFIAKEVVPPIDFDRLIEGQLVRFIPTDQGSHGNRLQAMAVEIV